MAVTFSIQNNRPDSANMYVLLTGAGIDNLTGIKPDVSTKWSDISVGNIATITFSAITGGRLYFALGEIPLNAAGRPVPIPDKDQYYGWIEFTKTQNDSVVWINLTNVDIFALPLSLKGTKSNGGSFSLGYQKTANQIVSLLEGALVRPSAPAKIRCVTGQIKIVAPNIMPKSYSSYDPYIQSLCNANAKLVIFSDRPVGQEAVRFEGNFRDAKNDADVIISMMGSNGLSFKIVKGQLTTEVLYRCDGGTLIYGDQTYNQNRTPGTSPSEVITNSVFRNICIGVNEGYFAPDGENDSSKFTSPFRNGNGNQYARIIYENSNSYGFPYADANLKTLETADPRRPITLTILRDDETS